MSNNRDTLIMDWNRADATAKAAVARERDLRKQVIDASFDKLTVGTNTLVLGAGYKLKAGITQSYSLQKDADDSYTTLVNILGQMNPETAKRLVRWKPEVSVSEYKKLTAEEQALINQVLVIKDNSPQLELVVPKAG